MKNNLLALCFLCISFASQAQEFDIRSFAAVPNDLSARKDMRRTVNDEPCALIKVVTNIKGMQFESNSGIVDVEHKEDGYWVYVWPRERRIKLMVTGYLSQDVQLPEPAKELMVYELVVAAKGNRVAQSDLVRITFRLNEADAYIAHGSNAPVMTSGTNAVYDLPRGTQKFTFRKVGFEDKVLDIEVDEPRVIDVALEPGTPSERTALPGFIIVTSEPSGAEVFLNDQRVGQTPYQGRQLPGSYRLALRNHLYHDHEERFDLAEAGTATLPVVKLKPRFGFVNLITDPAGAEVFLDGKMVGKSPVEGLQVESGAHTLSIRSAGYHERSESLAVTDGESKNLDFSLRPAFGTLIITSDPEGAEVFLDEQRAGVTPFRENRQPSGTYNVRLELPMHSTERGAVEVNDEAVTERFFALTKNYGTIRIESDGADVYLDGKKIGTGSFDHRAVPGSYTLTAKKDRHDDHSREVFLTLGQVETVTLNPEPRTGVLSIMTEPFEASGAEIWIDGEKTAYRTPAVVELLEGEYEIIFKKKGFNDYRLTTTVANGIQDDKKIQMNNKPPPGKLEIKATDNAYGSKVFVNDEDMGLIAPGILELKAGSYRITVRESGYEDIAKEIKITAGQTTTYLLKLIESPTKVKPVYPTDTVHCIPGGTEVVEVTNPKTGRTWMDRNLGAERAAISTTDEKAYGDLYQWGRFSDGHQCRNSRTARTLSESNAPDNGRFILASDRPFDWRSSQSDKLWQGKYGINNPCPMGFRLPTEFEWEQEINSWRSTDINGAFASPLKLNKGGGRGEGSGILGNVGLSGYYWSSTVAEDNARSMRLQDGAAAMSNGYRAVGLSVRCIKD